MKLQTNLNDKQSQNCWTIYEQNWIKPEYIITEIYVSQKFMVLLLENILMHYTCKKSKE